MFEVYNSSTAHRYAKPYKQSAQRVTDLDLKKLFGEETAETAAGEEGEEVAEPEAGPDPDALVPLTFELPADPVEPVEEPAAEPAAEEGAE